MCCTRERSFINSVSGATIIPVLRMNDIHNTKICGTGPCVRRFDDNNNEEVIWAVNYRFLYAYHLAQMYVISACRL